MECNKDEATRAKEIAERKFIAKDTFGAKKFALKAQNLFPALEGIPQMLATLDVYIAAENKINGEADWYGILGVDPLADDDTVRKHYRKLALMLHPDKNKSIGADGAFKLISEAWSLLSDKARRAAYDEKRNAKARKVSTKFGGSSAQTGVNGSYNFTKTTPSSARTQKNTGKEHTSSSTHKSKSNTFWTVCHRCKMQYEYLRIYLNLKLVCPNCHEPFLAVETAAPPSNCIKPETSWSFKHHQQNSNHQIPNKSKSNARKKMPAPNVGAGGYRKTDSHNYTNFKWAPFAKTSGVSNVAQAASVVQQAYDKVKREREEAQAAMKREEALRRKQHASKKGYFNSAKRRRGGMEHASVSNHGKEPVNRMGVGNGAVGVSNLCRSKQGKFEYCRVSEINMSSGAKNASLVELQNLMEKARKDIRQKLREMQSNMVDKFVVKESGDGFQNANEEGEKSSRNSETCSQNNIGKSEDRKSGSEAVKSFAVTNIAKFGTKVLETMPIDVPDPDFHDFYKDRTERSFGENQVWAAYNDDDGMPRYYAMIHSVISLDPFKMQISWLKSKTNSELGPLNWVASGFSKTCGDFRIGKLESCNSTSIFSHKIRWKKGNQGAVCIYPRKGDVWALYRNWSPDWNELTADEVIHKFDVVEVLEITEEQGVIVIPLVKVAGFKTVFHHHLDPREIRIIPREEMFRFSHQVPSYSLTGQEAPNAPKGCRVLDPAATPFELLQVIETVKEEDMMDSEDTFLKETSDNMNEADCKEMIGDMGKLGELKEGNNKDIQEIETLKEDKEKNICGNM